MRRCTTVYFSIFKHQLHHSYIDLNRSRYMQRWDVLLCIEYPEFPKLMYSSMRYTGVRMRFRIWMTVI